MHAVAIKVQLLLIDRNENLQRPFLNLAERFPVDAIGGLCLVGFICSVMFVPATVPVSGRCRRCGRSYSQACEKCDRVPARANKFHDASENYCRHSTLTTGVYLALITAMAFSIRRVAPSPRCVYRHVLCHQSAAMAFSIRPVAPSPSCVYRHILCHQLTAMAFSIRRVAPSPRCVYRHILCHRAAQHAVDPYRDTVARSQALFRARRSISIRFHSTCTSRHASRLSRLPDQPQAHGHSRRGGSLHGMSCPAQPCCRLRALAGNRRGIRWLCQAKTQPRPSREARCTVCL